MLGWGELTGPTAKGKSTRERKLNGTSFCLATSPCACHWGETHSGSYLKDQDKHLRAKSQDGKAGTMAPKRIRRRAKKKEKRLFSC